MMIGERTNVAGSPKFAKLIKEGNYEEAVAIARQQVDNGANVIDVCMDEGMIDGVAGDDRSSTSRSEPEIAKVPFMVDSSKWEVIEAGLKCLQGKGIVNSISLKEGEAKFLEQARTIQALRRRRGRHGLRRARPGRHLRRQDPHLRARLRILSWTVGFPPRTSSSTRTSSPSPPASRSTTTTPSTSSRPRAGSRPTSPRQGQRRRLQRLLQLPRQQPVREAMHAAFLYHAIRAGLDMGIVNAGMLEVYEEIPKELLDLVEDVLLNRRPDATERLVDSRRESSKAGGRTGQADREEARSLAHGPVEERLSHALVKGIDAFIDADTEEARRSSASRCSSSRARSWTA
jgi:5-methyltetrahydrofolate--homocysteine methyltransferase